MTPIANTKWCGKCSRDLPVAAFASDPSRKDKLSNKCRTCKSAMNRENYQRRKKNTMSHNDNAMVCYLDYSHQHRIAWNREQWMIQELSRSSWRTLAYVGSNSETLLNTIKRHRIIITGQARSKIEAWGRFLDWRDNKSRKTDLNVPHESLLAA